MKRIAFFGQKRVFSREGGVEVVVEELALRMVARGDKVTCIDRRGHHVSGKQHDMRLKKRYKGVQITSVPTIDKKGLAAVSASFFAALKAATGPYDVVHIHSLGPAIFCMIPKVFGKRVIVTCHGLDWDRPKWKGSFAGTFIKAGERMAVRFADEIIVLSAGMQEYFHSAYGRDTVLIPNGVSEPTYREANYIKERWNLEKDSYILFLSRLTPEKGVHHLIEAYLQMNTDKKLVIAGGSSDTDEYVEELYELAEEDPRIIFTGFVRENVLEELYSNAFIYCLPTELEGMPLTLLEAMSYGNCCLTSDIPECVNVVGGYGVFYRAGDPADLEDKLKFLVNSPDTIKRCKEAASEYICSRYNWDDVVRRTVALYEKR